MGETGKKEAKTMNDGIREETKTKEKQGRIIPRPALPFPVLGGASALYALFYTFCLYRNASGITYPFFAAGTLFYFFFCTKKYRVLSGNSAGGRKSVLDGVYVGFVLLLGISVCLTADAKIHLMTKTGIFLLTLTLVLRRVYDTGQWDFFGWLCRICRSLVETLDYLDTPFRDLSGWLGGKKGKEKEKDGRLWAAMTGLLAAIPFLIVILALLISADAVFSDLLERAVQGLNLWNAGGAAALTILVFLLGYSYLRGITSDRAEGAGSQKDRKKYQPISALVFTSLTAVVYLVFCGIQAAYLFWGKMRLPEGLTWAQYARQGFFQLLFVSLINLALVVICLAVFEKNRALDAVLAAISLMTYVMIASSAYRMLLYIRNYHLTFLRLFVLWALAVIAFLFAGVILSIYRKGFPLFAYCALTVAALYLLPAFCRPDYWIARYNVQQMEAGEYDDYGYLSTLCADAAPVLLDPDTAKVWDDTWPFRSYTEKIQGQTRERKIRGFNFSRWQAGKLAEGWDFPED